MSKRFGCLFIIFSFCLMLVVEAFCAEEHILSVHIDKTEISKGEDFSVCVSMDKAMSIKGIQFAIYYNFGKYVIKDIKKSDVMYDANVGSVDVKTNGVIKVAIINDEAYETSGELCVVHFMSREEAAPGKDTIKISAIETVDFMNETVSHSSIECDLFIESDDLSLIPLPEQPTNSIPPAQKPDEENNDEDENQSHEKPHKTKPSVEKNDNEKNDKRNNDDSSLNLAETVRKCEFVDVDGHWAYTDIVYLYESGILDGVSDIAFEPERYVTRAEFVKMISEIVELPACDDNKFDDISEQLWYFDVVNRASNVGIVKGEGEFFYPERNITREEMAVIIDRCIEYASPGILSGDGEVYEFKDDYAFSAWSVPSIDKLSGLGIINGIYGEFRPCDYATRAQAAVVIKRTINYV